LLPQARDGPLHVGRIRWRSRGSIICIRLVSLPTSLLMASHKNIALVAHDNRKKDLVEWVEWNYATLRHHRLVCTGTTGQLVQRTLEKRLGRDPDGFGTVDIRLLKSGPLGGDQQLGALIAEGEVDVVIFLWDPMSPHPHDVDVKALLRIAVVYNVPIACNRATADFLISSPLIHDRYERAIMDHSEYIERQIPPQ